MSMALDPTQRNVVKGIVLAALFSAAALLAGYLWSPWEPKGIENTADRLAFALTCDVFVFLWLLAGVVRVARMRFFSPQDMDGAGLTVASAPVKAERAVLQNTLEQVVLAVGAHLALAILLPAEDLGLIPTLVAVFAVGRLAFWLSYRRGATARAFGFGTTFYPTVFAYGLALILFFMQAF
jgi:hypothetical protein